MACGFEINMFLTLSYVAPLECGVDDHGGEANIIITNPWRLDRCHRKSCGIKLNVVCS